jgi:molecular chaperone GrpE
MMLNEQQAEENSEAAALDAGAETTTSPEAATQEQPSEAQPEAVPDLAAELAREREKATEYMQRWHRAQADLANYKRRAEAEREQVQKYGPAPLYLELLKMLDNFQRAFETLPVELREFSWVQGVALSYMQLDGLLRLYGVTPLETGTGQPFDPAIHEAVTHEETDAHPDGTVVSEYQRGYKLHDRVLRPALVRVAKAKASS